MNNQNETEVLSVAAASTYELTSNLQIYACPHTYKFRPFNYMTFRKKGGGEMEALYKVEDTFTLDLSNRNLEVYVKSSYPSDSTRILNYIRGCFTEWELPYKGIYRFYLLDPSTKIDLPHLPRPKVNNTGVRYYSLQELQKGEKFVTVVSKKVS